MSIFDPRKAYAADYRFAPGILRAKRTRPGSTSYQWFRIRELTLTHPDYPAAAESLGISGKGQLWEAWKEDLRTDDLKPNDILEIEDSPKPPKIVVRGTRLAAYNRWDFSSEEVPSDG